MKTWKVHYMDLNIQFKNMEKEFTEAFKRVMSDADFILRDDVKKFEESMANFLGVKHVIGVNSGTDALFLAVEAAGIKEGEEVITVGNTFVATIAVIVHKRAKPVLIDIAEDGNMDVNKIEAAITPKTRAILPVHLNGRACEMDHIMEIAKKHNLIVIEDAAQALGVMYKGKKAGSFGLIGCFSAHPLKLLSCAGDGGFVSTNSDEVAEKIRLLRDHGQKEKGSFFCYGYNSRLDNLQAALLNIKFSHLEEWIGKRREIARVYSENLADLPLILPPAPSEGDYFDTYNSYVIRTPYREELIEFLKVKEIRSFAHIPQPLYKHPNLGLPDYNFPVDQKVCSEVLSLPIFPEMTAEQVTYVIDSIHEFFVSKK